MSEKKGKAKKWNFVVELPCHPDVTDKIAKEKIAIAVADAFSYEDFSVVKVKAVPKPKTIKK